MRTIVLSILLIVATLTTTGQTNFPGHKIEYQLPAKNSQSGSFYLGRFKVGLHEITCNVSGTHANFYGWKIMMTKVWGGDVYCTQLFNTIGGNFHAQNADSEHYHLWWNPNSSNPAQSWTPYIKVEYQTGGYSIPTEPAKSANVLRILFFQDRNNIGIGTTTPREKLEVAGTIRATEIKVMAQTADFVFEDDYELRSLEEVEAFINDNGHLPDIPSAAEMEEDGIGLAEMNKLLLQKIEELTLYMIELKKEIEGFKK